MIMAISVIESYSTLLTFYLKVFLKWQLLRMNCNKNRNAKNLILLWFAEYGLVYEEANFFICFNNILEASNT